MKYSAKRYMKAISLFLSFALISIFSMPIKASAAVISNVKAPLVLSKTADKSSGTAGDEFTLNYTITPQNIDASKVNTNDSTDKEIVLVVDTSGSMGTVMNSQTGLTRLNTAKEAAVNFLEKFRGLNNIKIGLVEYADAAIGWNDPNSYTGVDSLEDNINNFEAGGGTNIGDGLRVAYTMLNNSDAAKKYVILLTDGEPTNFSSTFNQSGHNTYTGSYYCKSDWDYWNESYSRYYFIGGNGANDAGGKSSDYANTIAGIMAASNLNINSYMVGFTSDSNNTVLQQIASTAKGQYIFAKDDTALNEVYNNLADKVITDFSVTNAGFNEVFPDNVVPETITGASGLTISGQIVSGNISDINYCYNNGIYSADPVSFSIKVRIIKSSSTPYNISTDSNGQSESYITYTDIDGTNAKMSFSPVQISVSGNPVSGAPITFARTPDKSQYLLTNGSCNINLNYSITPQPIPVSSIDSNHSNQNKEIVLVVDTSGSMAWDIDKSYSTDSSKSRLNIVKNTLRSLNGDNSGFINKFTGSGNVKIALVSYNALGTVNCGLTDMSNSTQVSKLISAVNSLNAGGATNIGDGLRTAYWVLKNSGTNAEKYIVLMTDGYPTAFSYYVPDSYNNPPYKWGWWGYGDSNSQSILNSPNFNYFYYDSGNPPYYYQNSGETDWKGYSLTYSKNMAQNIIQDKSTDIQPFIVGFSSGINSSLLQQIAISANAPYSEAQSAADMGNIYSSIAGEISKALPITQVVYSETFPDGLVPTAVLASDGKPCSGAVIQGQTVTFNINSLGSLSYSLSSDGQSYIASPVNFTVQLTASKAGNYTLGGKDSNGNEVSQVYHSYVSYNDINGSTTQASFPSVSFAVNIPNEAASSVIKQGIFSNDINSASNVAGLIKANPDGSIDITNKSYCNLGVLLNTVSKNTSISIKLDSSVDFDAAASNVKVYKIDSTSGTISGDVTSSCSVVKSGSSIGLTLPDSSQYLITYTYIPQIEDRNLLPYKITNTVTLDGKSYDLTIHIQDLPDVG